MCPGPRRKVVRRLFVGGGLNVGIVCLGPLHLQLGPCCPSVPRYVRSEVLVRVGLVILIQVIMKVFLVVDVVTVQGLKVRFLLLFPTIDLVG